jgi:Arc/MetJ-type ribon-helix-helix transcriptional regulator
MTIKLKPNIERVLKRRVKTGHYATPEEVIAAGLAALEQQEALGDIGPGELNALVAEGEESIRRDGTLDGTEALRMRRKRRAARRGGKTP